MASPEKDISDVPLINMSDEDIQRLLERKLANGDIRQKGAGDIISDLKSYNLKIRSKDALELILNDLSDNLPVVKAPSDKVLLSSLNMIRVPLVEPSVFQERLNHELMEKTRDLMDLKPSIQKDGGDIQPRKGWPY